MTRFYKILLAVALVATACAEKIEQPPIALADVTEVVLEASSKMMVANGDDKVTFKVYGNGYDMTKWAKVYKKGKYESIGGTSFSTTETGVYEFWAEIGTTQTPKDEYVRVEAVAYQIPSAPSDPQPENTSFVKRAFVIQFTGTGCGYCPWFMEALEKLAVDASYAEKYVLAAAHTYPTRPADPMYIDTDYLSVDNYPYMSFDNRSDGLGYVNNPVKNIENIKGKIDASVAGGAEAGIAVNSELIGNYLTVKIQAKAAVSKEYYVSCWLVEDGIEADQSNYDKVVIDNVHNAAVRLCPASFEGKSLGVISAGGYSETAFTYSLDPAWNKDNCRLVAFVSKMYLNSLRIDNCISAPIGVPVQFQYAQ